MLPGRTKDWCGATAHCFAQPSLLHSIFPKSKYRGKYWILAVLHSSITGDERRVKDLLPHVYSCCPIMEKKDQFWLTCCCCCWFIIPVLMVTQYCHWTLKSPLTSPAQPSPAFPHLANTLTSSGSDTYTTTLDSVQTDCTYRAAKTCIAVFENGNNIWLGGFKLSVLWEKWRVYKTRLWICLQS